MGRARLLGRGMVVVVGVVLVERKRMQVMNGGIEESRLVV